MSQHWLLVACILKNSSSNDLTPEQTAVQVIGLSQSALVDYYVPVMCLPQQMQLNFKCIKLKIYIYSIDSITSNHINTDTMPSQTWGCNLDLLVRHNPVFNINLKHWKDT